MQLFFDTSAVVPLILKETYTDITRAAWLECEQAWAWDWMIVEAEAALVRRRADTTAWQGWRILVSQFNLVSLAPSSLDALCAFNRSLGLRAADAGHLFVHDRVLRTFPETMLITLDEEQAAAAKRLSLPAFTPKVK